MSLPQEGTGRTDAQPTNHITSAISGNGRFVVFGTSRKGLKPVGESPTHSNLFVRDMESGALDLVSVDPQGLPLIYPPLGYGSGGETISKSGRYVGFISDALNLVRGDTNLAVDVFVRDMRRDDVVRASVSNTGEQANGPSSAVAISGSGRFVVFQSTATNLVPGDTNGTSDVFVRDLKKGSTEIISVSSKGELGDDFSAGAEISSNGRFVAFSSRAANLVPGDDNDTMDVFVHDRATGKVERVSVSSIDEEGDAESGGWLGVSDNGRYVAFRSFASNLVPVTRTRLGVNTAHIYVRDRERHRTERVDVSSTGASEDAAVQDESLSDNGRFVVFSTSANFAEGDRGWAANSISRLNGEGDRDVYVYDRATGATELVAVDGSGKEGACPDPVSLLPIQPPPLPDQIEDLLEVFEMEATGATSGVPAISSTGRYVSFRTCADNLASNDKDVFHDIYWRDRGEVLSVGGFLRAPGDRADQRIVPIDPDIGTASATVRGRGGRTAEVNIDRARIIYRSSTEDFVLRLEVDHLARLAGSEILDPSVTYGFRFSVDGTDYEARGSASATPSDGALLLSKCIGMLCRDLRTVSGGVGNTGETVIITVPSEAVGIGPGSVLSAVSAFITRGPSYARDLGIDQIDLFR